jgi:hypothetical protein
MDLTAGQGGVRKGSSYVGLAVGIAAAVAVGTAAAVAAAVAGVVAVDLFGPRHEMA